MAQPMRKKKRLWSNIRADGKREEKFKETVTVMPGGTPEYLAGWERTFGKTKPEGG